MAAVPDLDGAFVGVGHMLGSAAAPAADAGASPPAAPAVAAQPKNRRLRRKTSLTADAPQPVLRRPASRIQKIRREVFENGGKTRSGLQRQDLRIVGSGKMVSKRRSDLSREAYKGSKLEQFNLCKKEAKVQLGIPANKFQSVGGKTPDGVRLLETTHAIRRMRFPEGPQG